MVVPPTGVLGTVLPGERDEGRGELERGIYSVVCTLPDIELGTGRGSGKAHYSLGMSSEVQVR